MDRKIRIFCMKHFQILKSFLKIIKKNPHLNLLELRPNQMITVPEVWNTDDIKDDRTHTHHKPRERHTTSLSQRCTSTTTYTLDKPREPHAAKTRRYTMTITHTRQTCHANHTQKQTTSQKKQNKAHNWPATPFTVVNSTYQV